MAKMRKFHFWNEAGDEKDTEQLSLKANQVFTPIKTEVDQIGYSHQKFQFLNCY
mgnify:CR=1 FL=1